MSEELPGFWHDLSPDEQLAWTSGQRKRRQRPGDQPLPSPNDGPSMHELVCEDLWRGGAAGKLEDAVIADMKARKRLGLERYGSLLQADNGRDALKDLYDELADAAVYARQVMVERYEPLEVDQLYTALLHMLVQVRGMLDAGR